MPVACVGLFLPARSEKNSRERKKKFQEKKKQKNHAFRARDALVGDCHRNFTCCGGGLLSTAVFLPFFFFSIFFLFSHETANNEKKKKITLHENYSLRLSLSRCCCCCSVIQIPQRIVCALLKSDYSVCSFPPYHTLP